MTLRGRVAAAGALLTIQLLVLTGCAKQATTEPAAAPSATGGASAASASCLAGPSMASKLKAAVGDRVPTLQLKCFNGAGQAALTDLKAPTIINLWASWCEPCRTELPAVQAYANRAQGSVRVIGVVTRDNHDSAQAFIKEHNVTIPMLEDPDQRLLTAIGRNALPVTLFVNADGRIAYVYNSTALDAPTLESLAQKHLGITLPL